MKWRRPLAWHPLLFAVYPILFLYAVNQREVAPADVVKPLVLALGTVLVAAAITTWLYRDHRRASLVVSALTLLFFSYGHARAFLPGSVAGLRQDLFLSIGWGVLALLAVWGTIRLRRPAGPTRFLNVTALILVGLLTVQLIASEPWAGTVMLELPNELISRSGSGSGSRDIVYLVFDRYGGPMALEAQGIDNSSFLEDLERRGFYVAALSYSNYPRTAHSLAASLHMTYLDDMVEQVGPDSDDWIPLYWMLEWPRVAQLLQEEGYLYVHLGSWWWPTGEVAQADVNLAFSDGNEFGTVLIETTVLPPILNAFGVETGLAGGGRHYLFARYQLQNLPGLIRAIRNDGRPTFLFAHLLLPHPPYVFDIHGRYVEEGSYAEQLAFTNRMIMRFVDELLAGPVEEHPVVVIQSDEGPHPARFGSETFDWPTAQDEELLEKFNILNAYYLPGEGTPDPYPTITPVNSFRLVLDRYLGTDLGLVPDRSYVYVNEQRLYDFVEVTDRLPSDQGQVDTDSGG